MSRLPAIENPHRKPYPSDLSDAEWLILKPLLPTPKGFGHPVEVDLREILNAIFYVQRTGCQLEMLPHDLPPYTTVYGYFQKWQRKGFNNHYCKPVIYLPDIYNLRNFYEVFL
jgi:putative transposase